MIRGFRRSIHPTVVPIAFLLVGWWLLPFVVEAPAYKLPRISLVWRDFWQLLSSGVLIEQTLGSIGRLAQGFVIGGVLGLVVGFAVASSRQVAAFLEPVLVFFQAIAGIAWIPLAIVWFGFGPAPVIFVVANGIFFIVLLNTTLGVQSISPVVRNAVRTLGGSRLDVVREVVIPGALANVLTGLRLGLGFGWKALVAAEIIAGGRGIGYMASEASQRYDGPTVLVAIGVIGTIWLMTDRFVLRPIESRTIRRWGMVQQGAI